MFPFKWEVLWAALTSVTILINEVHTQTILEFLYIEELLWLFVSHL